MLNNSFLQKYMEDGYNQIEGWVQPKIINMLDFFDWLPINKSGDILEIGIHHGRFFIALNQLRDNSSKAYAIDVFDDQHLNIDNSGGGSVQIFNNNLDMFDHRNHGANVQIIKGDSTDAGLLNHIDTGSISYMSIDGGHTVEHTINDLKLAERLLHNEGIVILDDINNHWWMSVVEGLCKYMMTHSTLIPIAVGDNKMFLSKLSYHSYYIQRLQESPFHTKTSKFFSRDIVSI